MGSAMDGLSAAELVKRIHRRQRYSDSYSTCGKSYVGTKESSFERSKATFSHMLKN